MKFPLPRCLWAPLLILLAACSEDPELPPVAPLETAPEIVKALYGAQPGEREVVKVADVELPAVGEQRALTLNAYYPATGGNYPVLLFSHGNWSDKNSYDRLIEHWVSHGYVVLAPDHLDCCSMAKGIFNSLLHGNLGLIQARVGDIQRIIDGMDDVEAAVPALAGKVDATRLALTGHSFGAFSAQQFGGAAALDPDSGDYHGALDERVSAVVALSPPGPMFDEITEDSWNRLVAPTLVTTGTWDVQPGFWPDWRDHLMSFQKAMPGDKYALVVEGADHFLGNLICRTDREATPQEDALTMVLIASTAFLDAHLKGSPEARALLAGDSLGETTGDFARLSRR